ncbi:hypothetical protein N9L68_02145 [bacterium]|nr:hypothetical protein [bacterium]
MTVQWSQFRRCALYSRGAGSLPDRQEPTLSIHYIGAMMHTTHLDEEHQDEAHQYVNFDLSIDGHLQDVPEDEAYGEVESLRHLSGEATTTLERETAASLK